MLITESSFLRFQNVFSIYSFCSSPQRNLRVEVKKGSNCLIKFLAQPLCFLSYQRPLLQGSTIFVVWLFFGTLYNDLKKSFALHLASDLLLLPLELRKKKAEVVLCKSTSTSQTKRTDMYTVLVQS